MIKTVQTLVDGVTYNGSIRHCIINYVLILLVLLPHLRITGKQQAIRMWFSTFITAVLVQALLWFVAGAVGVSVVWCAMAGFNLVHFYKSNELHTAELKRLYIVGFVASFTAIVYYAVLFPAITTVAHGIAVGMGAGLFYLYRRLFN